MIYLKKKKITRTNLWENELNGLRLKVKRQVILTGLARIQSVSCFLQETLWRWTYQLPQQLVSVKDDLSLQRWAKSGHCSIVLFYQWVRFDFHKMFHCTYESILKISRMWGGMVQIYGNEIKQLINRTYNDKDMFSRYLTVTDSDVPG